jgi:hypothetical protein
MENDDICIQLNSSVTSDDVDSASWDFDWVFTGTHPQDPDGTNAAGRQAKAATNTPHLIHDPELDQTFQIGKGTHALLAAITERCQEDQYQTALKDTYVIMVHDATHNKRYLIIRGPHNKEIKHQIAEKFQISDIDAESLAILND